MQFQYSFWGASFYFMVIMTLERYIFPLNSIRSYFNGGLSFVVFSIVEGNVNIFSGITKRYVLIISLCSIKKTFWTRCHFRKWSFVWIRHHKFFYRLFRIKIFFFLIWAGLRHSVPKHHSNCLRSEISLILTIDNKKFVILEKKSKDYYKLIKRIIAQCPNNSKHLCQDFNLTQDQLKKVFPLPHEVTFEPYLKVFQNKVLNSIFFTNKKLSKIGNIQDDKCSLCKTDSESLYHILCECRHTEQFWKKIQYYYYTLTREFVCLTLQDVITGILYTNCPLLNYLILIAKLYLWGCRKNQTLRVITAFSSKVKIKYETEKYICVKTNKTDKFNKKWVLPLDSVP